MAEQRTYSDFDLMVEAGGGTDYRVRVVDSPAGQASGTFTVPFSDLELENFLLRVGRPRRGTRRLESPDMEAVRDFGTKLFDAVFQNDVKVSLRLSLDEAERRDQGLRIRLRLSDTPELASLPWEFLFDSASDDFLVLSAWTPVIRYLDLVQHIAPLTVTGPMRILVMISSPDDYPPLDVEDEWRRVERALAPLVERGAVVIDRADTATLAELQERLVEHHYHVFHYLGHGGFDAKADDGVLVLEDGNNRSRLVSGSDLGTILRDHRSLRLAVLNACEGARASEVDPFSGTAQRLVRKGIPGVVAMQFEITDDAAITFAQGFYTAIAKGRPLEAAIGEARRAIFARGNDIEWGTPVVYLRGEGTLFQVDPATAVAAASVEPLTEATEQSDSEAIDPAGTAATVLSTVAADGAPSETTSDGALSSTPPSVRRIGARPIWGWAAAAVSVVFAIVLLAIIVGDDPSETTTVTTASLTTFTTASLTTVTAPTFEATELFATSVEASSFLAGWEPENLIDGDPSTLWSDESLHGIGAVLTFEFSDPVSITEIELQNLLDDEGFKRNYKIQGYLITTDDLTVDFSGRLDNVNDPQRIPIASLGTRELTIQVMSTYPAESAGGKPPFDELALLSVRFFGNEIGES